jgi:hypothetical protein
MLCYCDTDPQAGWALGGQISNKKKKSAACDQFVFFFLFFFAQGLGREHTKRKYNPTIVSRFVSSFVYCFPWVGTNKKGNNKGTKVSHGYPISFLFFCFADLAPWSPVCLEVRYPEFTTGNPL